MSGGAMITVDGNEAVAMVAHRASEVIAIYPITPSSTMGELADEWSAAGKKNLWGQVPQVVEMQSEAGAAGAVHGALQGGAMATTFTASQGLLLMIPNLYKIAGELTPLCLHVAARTLATHALSIFGDHSDVMACRQCGIALLASGSVQEAHDMALVGHAATLKTRIPFLHFFDGFRTSHEVAKIKPVSDEDMLDMLDPVAISQHRERALTPDRPVVRGTAQNPDTFFQAREAANLYYLECPSLVQKAMDHLYQRTGRRYHLFDYVGDPEADRVIVAMGSGATVVDQAVQRLNERGAKLGVIKVRLYRPFDVAAFLAVLPNTVKSIAVLDRTKEPGAIGEPLYTDIMSALHEGKERGLLPVERHVRVIGGRYGLSSKDFTPAMAKAVFDELLKDKPKNHFTIGIVDDVTYTSLPYDPEFNVEGADIFKAVFYGLGADGTVGANKNTIKIIGEETDNYAQGYFVYDSKKSGAVTVSHLRFGPRPIRSAYLIKKANFVACHQFTFLDKYDVLETLVPGGVFLMNAPYPAADVWDELPREIQQQLIDKKARVYTIDAYKVAREADLGGRINTIMQTCFFAISGVMPREEAIAQIKKAIQKTYGKRGQAVVQSNWAAVDKTLENLHEVKVPASATGLKEVRPAVADEAPDFVKRVTAVMLSGKGDLLPVSAFPVDGTWPVGTSKWEKRNIATEIPVWEPQLCIQCNKCALVCPHAAIRAKAYEPAALKDQPASFKVTDYKAPDLRGMKFTIQVAPEDCTGCNLCVEICPAKDRSEPNKKAINMVPQEPLLQQEKKNFEYFMKLPDPPRELIRRVDAKGSQFFEPLIEFSGACSGCGETPYIKLVTQLFGDRALIANATGCSSIFGGNLPTTPYCANHEGRGPAWANSLFEDNAEFGLGFRLAVDKHANQAAALIKGLAPRLGDDLVKALLEGMTKQDEVGIKAQRQRIAELRAMLRAINTPDAALLAALADYLVPKSVWLVGGDGWAYDIGYGGLDHVMAQNHNVNILVLDTEVYSNTGGQASKATPLGAAAKFAASGKTIHKKDLGLIAMSYGHVYVASVALGANDNHTVKVLQEAESYNGTSLVIAYAHCIAHGIHMDEGLDHQKLAVNTGFWPLYRYDPRRMQSNQAPLVLDSTPKADLETFYKSETRFGIMQKLDPNRFKAIIGEAQKLANQRYALYEQLATTTAGPDAAAAPAPTPKN